MTEKLSQESLADLQPLGSRLLDLVPFKPGASKTGLKEHFRLPSPQVLVTSWECNSEHWHRLVNPGLWGGPGCGSLSVLQVALQRGSGGFASGEFLGRAWALLLCRAWMLFPVVAFGLEFGNASSHPVTICTTAAALGRVCCRGKSLLCCPSAPLLLHLFPLQNMDLWNLWCGLCSATSGALPKSNLGFQDWFCYLALCTLWSDVLNLLALVPKCLLTSEGLGYCHKCGVVIKSGVSAQEYVHNVMSN